MKKMILILMLCLISGLAFATAEQQQAPSKSFSIVNEDEEGAGDLNVSNHDVQPEEDQNDYSPPGEESDSGHSNVTQDDDYN